MNPSAHPIHVITRDFGPGLDPVALFGAGSRGPRTLSVSRRAVGRRRPSCSCPAGHMSPAGRCAECPRARPRVPMVPTAHLDRPFRAARACRWRHRHACGSGGPGGPSKLPGVSRNNAPGSGLVPKSFVIKKDRTRRAHLLEADERARSSPGGDGLTDGTAGRTAGTGGTTGAGGTAGASRTTGPGRATGPEYCLASAST